MLLDDLPTRTPATITGVEWDGLPLDEAKRLRAMGIEEGIELVAVHRGILFGRDPIAIRTGRMTIAVRRLHARAIRVSPIEVSQAAGAHP